MNHGQKRAQPLFYPQHQWLLEPNTPKAQYLGLPRVSPIGGFLDPPPPSSKVCETIHTRSTLHIMCKIILAVKQYLFMVHIVHGQ